MIANLADAMCEIERMAASMSVLRDKIDAVTKELELYRIYGNSDAVREALRNAERVLEGREHE